MKQGALWLLLPLMAAVALTTEGVVRAGLELLGFLVVLALVLSPSGEQIEE
ncbi:hypothetical protein [Ferrimonas sediminicola]|uniref:hypothetical protein n=1 Tax=Ferrimonas sediminicola TaxID=2569538 RepID=UPI00145F6F96|nr:hypothetical protein [Ferrimonas sediminicola]